MSRQPKVDEVLDANTNEVPAEKPPKSEKVEIDGDILKRILDSQETLKGQIASLQEENKLLKFAADKGRVSRFEAERKGDLIRTYNLGLWEIDTKDKTKDDGRRLVVGWTAVRDTVHIDETRRIKADQVIKLFLKDKEGKITELEVDYLYFAEQCDSIAGELIKKKTEETALGGQKTLFVLEFPEFGQVEVDQVFVNPF